MVSNPCYLSGRIDGKAHASFVTILSWVRKGLHKSQLAHQAGGYPGFCSVKRLGIFLLPPGWDELVHRRINPSIKFAGSHFYTWVERVL